MKVQSSDIALSGRREYSVRQERRETVSLGSQNRRQVVSPANTPARNRDSSVVVSLSSRNRALNTSNTRPARNCPFTDSSWKDFITALAEMLMEAITGKKHSLRKNDLNAPESRKQIEMPQITMPDNPVPTITYQTFELNAENEKTTFSANGTVKTENGETIDFSLDLTLSRQFLEMHSSQVTTGAAQVDPLVISFDGRGAGLTEKTVSFDLDTDGTKERIPFVTPNAGFLLLDKNGNGSADNGSELFGPSTGSGFGELARYDEDANGWIDEGDSVFGNLRVWTKDTAGKDYLFRLSDKGIGAIYLKNADSQFRMTDSAGQTLGQVRSSGVYLKENGEAGVVQHIDLTVTPSESDPAVS